MPTPEEVTLFKHVVRLTRDVPYDEIGYVVQGLRDLLTVPVSAPGAPSVAAPRVELGGLDRMEHGGSTREENPFSFEDDDE